MEPLKSPNDYRKYRIINLENGIKVLLISDINENEKKKDDEKKETKLAAAALRIKVGSFDDPPEVEGLAHFLEHMVFMGSEKYATENDFSAFVKAHGGSENASTAYEFTNFFFEVQPEHFGETLDRFAQFFISPLLREDAVNREIKAVDSEFRRSLQEDDCRIEQILAQLAKKDHPFSRFTWGNKESLSTIPEKNGVNVMKLLREFFQHYCKRQATLALCSTESLDTLEEFARKYFSKLPSRTFERISNTEPEFKNPFELEDFHKLYYVMPVRDSHTVDLRWVIPSQYRNYRDKLHNYIGWLVSHRGRGSIHSILREKGYISYLNCWSIDYTIYSMVEVCFELTDEGMDNIKEVIHIFFQYITMLQNQGASKRIHDEMKKMSAIEFRYLEPCDPSYYVEGLVEDMQNYKDEDFIKGNFYLNEFNGEVGGNGELIEEMQKMLVPETANIIIASKKFQHLCKEEERWFGTKYCQRDIPEEWLDPVYCKSTNDKLHLPAENRFIAENFEIKNTEDEKQLYPMKIEESENHQMWFKQDQKFKLPKAECIMKLVLPLHGEPAHYFTCVSMFDSLLDYTTSHLDHETYLASMSQCSGHNNEGHRTISACGYNDKLLVVFQKHIDLLAKLEFTERDFQVCKENMRRFIRNDLIVADELVEQLIDQILDKVVESPIETRNRLETFTVESFKEFTKQYLSEMYIESLFQGNVTKEDAKNFHDYIKKTWNYKPIPRDHLPKAQLLKLPKGRTLCRHTAFNPNDPNTVIRNYYQVGPTSLYVKTIGGILNHLMDEPVFDYLRTQKQLGYVVGCNSSEDYGILGFWLYVQTQKGAFSADEVDDEMENFLSYFEKKLSGFTGEEYQKYITSFVALLKTADLSLSDEVGRHWSTICDEEYLFDLRYKMIEVAERIAKEDVLNFLRTYLMDKTNRRVLCTQVIGHKEEDNNSKENESESSSDSGSESGSDDGQRKFIPCPDNLDIREYKPIPVDCKDQYTRCVTDIQKFKDECDFYPHTKLVY